MYFHVTYKVITAGGVIMLLRSCVIFNFLCDDRHKLSSDFMSGHNLLVLKFIKIKWYIFSCCLCL